MIRRLSEKIARYIANNDESADFEVLVYGYDVLLQEVFVFLITLILALPFGLFFHVLIALVSYNLLRRYAGGVHAKYRTACITSSVAIMFGPAVLFGKLGYFIPFAVMPGLFVFSLALLLLYAPADTEMKPVRTPSKRRSMKTCAAVLLTAYFTAALLLVDRFPAQSSVLAVTATIVSCFTHPWAYKIYGCEKSKNSMIKMEAVK